MKVWELFLTEDVGDDVSTAAPAGDSSQVGSAALPLPPTTLVMPPGETAPTPPTPPLGGGMTPDHMVPPGWEYSGGGGLWGGGLLSNLYWIITGNRIQARMKELGLTPKQRSRIKEATDRAKNNLTDWITGRNQRYNGQPGWVLMPVNTVYGTYKIAGKEGSSKTALAGMVKSKAQSVYKKELKALPKAIRKPIRKSKAK